MGLLESETPGSEKTACCGIRHAYRIEMVSLRHFSLVLLVIGALSLQLDAQRPELLYLRFNAGMGSVVVDQSLPGLPGTTMVLQNGFGWNSVDPVIGNSSLRTDGALPNPIPLCETGFPVNYTGDWTLEVWAKKTIATTGNSVEKSLFGRIGAGAFRIGYVETVRGEDSIVLEGPGINSAYILGGGKFNVWQHLAYVHDSNDRTITPFLNGVPQTPVVQNQVVDIIGDGSRGLILGGVGGGHWPGSLDEFRLSSRTLSGAEIQSRMNAQVNAVAVDAAVSEIISPAITPSNYAALTATETVEIRVSNLGTTPLASGTTIPVSYSVNGGVSVNENLILSSNLQTGESETHVFAAPADLSAAGMQELVAAVAVVGDTQPNNDSKAKSVGSDSSLMLNEFPLVENFDQVFRIGLTPPPLWHQDKVDGGDDWFFTNDPALLSSPNASTPAFDHTTESAGAGFMAIVETATSSSDTTLYGPLIQLSGSGAQSLDFWLHSFNATSLSEPDNTLSVDIVAFPSGVVILDALGPIGSEALPQWVMKSIDLTALAGQIIQPLFRVNSSMNLTSHDIAIDDVRVNPFGPGQTPQPGLSYFDLNSAQSPGGLGVPFLEPGPYLAQGMPGQPLNFHFQGEPDQPIILLFGNYNPAAATFPSAGQMDIGGPINPMTGIPTNVFALFDGNLSSGLNPLFKTNINGVNDVLLITPSIPPGLLTTFQAAIANSSLGVVLSNAIQLEIQ